MEVSFLRTTKVIKIATKGFSSLFKLTQEEASYMQEEKLLSMERNMHALCSFGLIWLISYPFLANKQYFFLAPNQPTVLSVMTYRSIKPIRRRATQAHHPLFFFSFFHSFCWFIIYHFLYTNAKNRHLRKRDTKSQPYLKKEQKKNKMQRCCSDQ